MKVEKLISEDGGIMVDVYFAPMEGITGYIFRNAYRDVVCEGNEGGGIDKFFSPFIAPGVNQHLAGRELRDILPENNRGVYLVPQVLGSRAEDILIGINDIKELGYEEVNLNFGCPSGTVVAKKKGAGMLAYTEELDELLYRVYEKADIKVSVKTRIGKSSGEEFYEILEVYNKYPMEELIVHPRVREDFYKNKPNMEMFEYAVRNSRNRLCYNGDITSVGEYEKIVSRYCDENSNGGLSGEEKRVSAVMIGRGFLKNPLLSKEIWTYNSKITYKREDMNKTRDTQKSSTDNTAMSVRTEYSAVLKRFHDRLLADYTEEMSGERPVLFKMKELWSYMGDMYSDSEKLLKKLRKTESLQRYNQVADEIMQRPLQLSEL